MGNIIRLGLSYIFTHLTNKIQHIFMFIAFYKKIFLVRKKQIQNIICQNLKYRDIKNKF